MQELNAHLHLGPQACVQMVSNRLWSCRLLRRPPHSTCYSKPGHLITGSPHHSASVPRQLSEGLKQKAPALVNRDWPGRQTMISQLYTVLFRAQGGGEFSRTPPPHALSSFPMCHLGTGEIVFQKNIIPIKHKTVLLENKDLHCSGFRHHVLHLNNSQGKRELAG